MSEADTSGGSLSAAAKTLDDFSSGTVASATKTIDDAVTRTFRSVENTIARAALSGKTSMSKMVEEIIADFNRVATKEFIVKPVEGAVSSLIGSLLPISGARAAGGSVAAGSAYLVGEQGPEVFVPSASGAIASNSSLSSSRSSITLNVQAQDAHSFLKSESQIAAMMCRAMQRGQRNM